MKIIKVQMIKDFAVEARTLASGQKKMGSNLRSEVNETATCLKFSQNCSWPH